jgi:trehalose synthase
MFEVPLEPRSLEAFDTLLETEDRDRLERAAHQLREVLAGRTLWHVNSTKQGGGVAELLSTLLPYLAGAGVDVHWLVIEGTDEFFELTKRLHNHLHDSNGDARPLGDGDRVVYDQSLAPEAEALATLIGGNDVAVLHDPQPAGLLPGLARRGVSTIWRCHIGVDEPGRLVKEAWAFLEPDVAAAERCVFSRQGYVWEGLDPDRVAIIPPCIDIASPKNHPMSRATNTAILDAIGVISAASSDGVPTFVGTDGTPAAVRHRALVTEATPIPSDARWVVQVSRWDRLKDPLGVLTGFVTGVLPCHDDAHLVLAGPETDGVDDDPEGAEVFAEVVRDWEALPADARARAHLVRLPMADDDENSAMVNALQRQADVVVQKSLAEGFGLTVAEAMWKQRAVVASRVGGIQDQIVLGESGVLLDDPGDLDAFGRAVCDLLADRPSAEAMGRAARRRVCDCFLPTHHFEREADLLAGLSG